MHVAPFLLVAVAVVINPGVDMALVTKNALVHGREAAVATALGINVGIALWTVAAALGVAAVVQESAPAFAVIKLAGAAYLGFLGVQRLRAARRGAASAAGPPSAARLGTRGAFRQGLVSNLLNPKIAVFFTSLLPVHRSWGITAAGPLVPRRTVQRARPLLAHLLRACGSSRPSCAPAATDQDPARLSQRYHPDRTRHPSRPRATPVVPRRTLTADGEELEAGAGDITVVGAETPFLSSRTGHPRDRVRERTRQRSESPRASARCENEPGDRSLWRPGAGSETIGPGRDAALRDAAAQRKQARSGRGASRAPCASNLGAKETRRFLKGRDARC
jgi:hypothetical protein